MDYTLTERTAETPENAGLCIVMDDVSMEPYIMRGETVYIDRRKTPAELEVGLFFYSGRAYIRQWCEDYSGAVHLLCINPKCEDMNIRIPKSGRGALLCLGSVISGRKPPSPL